MDNLKAFFKKLIKNQRDIEPEFNNIVNENFWELVSVDEPIEIPIKYKMKFRIKR